MMHRVFLLLGCNLGNCILQLHTALEKIAERVGNIRRRSSIYTSEAWGFESDLIFYNQAVEVETTLSPEEVLDTVLTIERELGRVRTGRGYASRTMDIDLIFYDDLIRQTEELTLPHPLMQERAFVLYPMEEIAADFVHPVFHKTVSCLKSDCKDPACPKIWG